MVLQVDLPMCWNTRRTSRGYVGLLFAQKTQYRLIWMNEVMKIVVDGTSFLLTSNRTNILLFGFLCDAWNEWLWLWSKAGTRSDDSVKPRFTSSFFLLLLFSSPDWRYASRVSYYIWWRITFSEVCKTNWNVYGISGIDSFTESIEVEATTFRIGGHRISHTNNMMFYTQMMKFRLHDAHIRKERKKRCKHYNLDLNRH